MDLDETGFLAKKTEGIHVLGWLLDATVLILDVRGLLPHWSIPMSENPDRVSEGPSRKASNQDLGVIDEEGATENGTESKTESGTTNPAFVRLTPAEEEFLALDRDHTIVAVSKESSGRTGSFIDSVHNTPSHLTTTRSNYVSVPYSVHNYVRNRADSVLVPLEVHRHVYNQRAFDREFGWEPRQEYQEYKDMLRATCCISGSELLTKFITLFPILTWLPKYNLRHHFITDMIVGITVGVMHIPQGLAYGTLANVPPVNGLYASFITVAMYMIFGTSAHVSFGTFAVLSLLVGQVIDSHPLLHQLIDDLQAIHGNDTVHEHELIDELSVEISQTLSLLIGIFLVIMGVCRIGFITAYLSDQVIAGFSTGGAVLTVTSQLAASSGLRLSRKNGPFSIFEIYVEFFSKIPQINWWTALVTCVASIFLFVGKVYINPITAKYSRIPVPWDLIAVIVGTIVSYSFDMENTTNLSVVGDIPLGIKMGVPNLTGSMIRPMITDAISISFVVYVLTVSLGKLFAKKFHYAIDIAQEPYAYGLANIASSFFMGIACCAALTRSQVLADLHAYTPAVLAAIIIVALKGVFMQFTQLPRLWRVSKYDFGIWVVSFVATVVLDVQFGLIFSILCALFSAIVRSQWPPAVMQGQLPGTDIYFNKLRYKRAISIPNVFVFRYDAALMFTNSERFRLTLFEKCGIDLNTARHEIALIDTPASPPNAEIPTTKEEIKQAKKASKQEKKAAHAASIIRKKAHLDPSQLPSERDRRLGQIRRRLNLPDVIVLDCSGFNYIDYMGVSVLTEVYGEVSELGILLLYAVMKAQARDMLDAAEFFNTVSKMNVFPTVHDAVTYGLYKVERDRLFEDTASEVKIV